MTQSGLITLFIWQSLLQVSSIYTTNKPIVFSKMIGPKQKKLELHYKPTLNLFFFFNVVYNLRGKGGYLKATVL